MHTSITEVFDGAEKVFNFNESENVKPAMAKYGYNEAKMAEGKKLLSTARNATDNQVKEYGEQYQVYNDYEKEVEVLSKKYAVHIDAAKFIFREKTNAQTALELNGRRKITTSGIFFQMENFYNRLLDNPEWISAMNILLITKDELVEQQNGIKNARVLKDRHSREMGEAQQATTERDAALEALDSWVNDYVKVAHFALAATPLLLKGLKTTVRSSSKPRKSKTQRDDE
jgi:hypothetical protein